MTVLWLGLMVGSVHAQIKTVSGTVRDEIETLIGASVCEVDGTGRTINATITDFNGHFAMKVKSTKNKRKPGKRNHHAVARNVVYQYADQPESSYCGER